MVHKRSRLLLITASFLLAAVFYEFGCSSNSSNNPNTNNVSPGSMSTTQVRVTDSPSDDIVAFNVTINSIVLTSNSGATVTLLDTPMQIEVSHLSGQFQVLKVMDVPQDSYASATVTISSPSITVFNSTTHQPQDLSVTLTSPTVDLTFSPALMIGGPSNVLDFDFRLNDSVTINGSTATVDPVFKVNAHATQNDNNEDDGMVDGFTGKVTTVSGTTFTVTSFGRNNSTVTFTTNSSTQFQGVTDFSGITSGEIVKVEASPQTDGTLLAVEVKVRMLHSIHLSLDLEGPVTQVTGNPATSIQLVLIDCSDEGAPLPGSGINVGINSNTTFVLNDDDVDLTGLPFTPQFDATTIIAGQNVEVDTSLVSFTGVTANSIELESSTVTGTVSGVTTSGGIASFTLTVPPDSVFAMLTGQTTLTVYQHSSTSLSGMTTVANGDIIHATGLVFLTKGTSLNLVAKRIANDN